MQKINNIINLGCRLNIYEGEVIKSLASQNNIKNYTIINSCAVTAKAEKKLRYEIRKAKRKYPNNKIVVTGCAAQISPKKYSNIKDVNYVIGNKEKLESSTWASIENAEFIQVNDIFEITKNQYHKIENFDGKARAYIEVQHGCDHRCTFCIIPYGRGNNKSVPVGIIVNHINTLVNNGYNEIVLTGVDITHYGKDLPGSPNLFQLVRRIFNLAPKLKQLRLSSIDCAEINEDFWPLLKEKRFMPYFHLSLQSGNDLILKRMKRRHSKKEIIDFCNKVRKIRSDVVFGADIIAGFPTETKKMFEDTIEVIDKCNLTHLHIFPYSKRKLTPASKMPQVPSNIIKERARILRNIGKKNLLKYLKKQIGSFSIVLVEKNELESSIGKSQYFTKVKINKNLKEGSLVKCKIYDVEENILQAKIL